VLLKLLTLPAADKSLERRFKTSADAVNSAARLEVLLLLGALATLVVWLVDLAARV
jgi:hypothetical protein